MKVKTVWVCSNCEKAQVQEKKPEPCCSCADLEKGLIVFEPKYKVVIEA